MMKRALLPVIVLLLLTVSGYGQTTPPANLTTTLDTTLSYPVVALSWQYDSVATSTRLAFTIYKKEGLPDDTSSHFIQVWTTPEKHFTDYHDRPGETYSYYVTATQRRNESSPSDTASIAIPPPITGIISGMATDDSTGLPLLHAMLNFIPQEHALVEPLLAMTDSNGFYKAHLRPGQYFISAGAPGYALQFYNGVTNIRQATPVVVNANDSLTMNFSLTKFIPPAVYSLSGWVKNADGNPVRAEVTAYVINQPMDWRPDHRIVYARTDSLGNYMLRLKSNDTVVIYVATPNPAYYNQFWDGKSTFADADRIAMTGDITGINVTLVAKTVYANGISGNVLDSTGVTPLKAQVYAFKKVNDRTVPARYYALTDSVTGNYSLANLEPGNYILLSWSFGYRSTYFKYDGSQEDDWRNADSVVVTSAGVDSNINFRLIPFHHRDTSTVVFGNIKGNQGTGIDAALIRALDANGDVEGCAVSELDGSYVLQGLPAGTYSLVSGSVSFQNTQTEYVDVNDNAMTQVDMALTPDAVLGVTPPTNVAKEFTLAQNFPNPFNPGTQISYQVPKSSFVTLKVYNILGNEVATLVNGIVPPGQHQVQFNGIDLPSGVYYVKFEANNTLVSVKKMMLMK